MTLIARIDAASTWGQRATHHCQTVFSDAAIRLP